LQRRTFQSWRAEKAMTAWMRVQVLVMLIALIFAAGRFAAGLEQDSRNSTSYTTASMF
jgi:hypothetical protein